MSWPSVKLSDVLEFHRGITFKPEDKVETFSSSSVVCMRTKNVQAQLDESDIIAVPESFVKRDELYLQEGDLLISSANSWNLVGKVVRIPQLNYRATAGGFISILRPLKQFIDPDYLYRFIGSDEQQHKIRHLGRQTTNISNLDRKRFLDLRIPLPPLSIQKQIAVVLEKADRLRQQSQQMEQELNSLAQSVFLDMFGDPILNPKGWARDRLGNRLSIKHGYAFSGEYFTSEGEYILLTPGNFFEEGGYRDRKEKQKYYIGEIPEGYILEKNNLLVAMTEQTEGLLGSSMFVPESNKFLHNQRLGLVDLEIGQNEYFYYFLFNNLSVRKSIQASSTGLKVKHTSPKKIEAIEVGIPPVDMQQKFEARVKKIWEQIKIIRKTATESDLHFNSLMQRAFKGVLEIKDVA